MLHPDGARVGIYASLLRQRSTSRFSLNTISPHLKPLITSALDVVQLAQGGGGWWWWRGGGCGGTSNKRSISRIFSMTSSEARSPDQNHLSVKGAQIPPLPAPVTFNAVRGGKRKEKKKKFKMLKPKAGAFSCDVWVK